MIRNIYVGENYSRKVTTPLLTTDRNSYKIIWDCECTTGVFKITALKSDETSVFDFGEITGDGFAAYVMKSSMYDTEGPLKLYLTIVKDDSVTTCREINFIVKKGADETTVAENNINQITELTNMVAKSYDTLYKLENFDTSDVYVLKYDEDITVSDGIVTKLLKHDFSMYNAIAFPEGITEIRLPDTNSGGDSPLIANKVIMPKSLKTIGLFSFSNWAKWDEEENLIEDSIVVKVKEYVLNEGLETIEIYAFSDNIYLEKINIPSSVKTISRGVFQYCDGLKEIFIPTSVTEINDGNFTVSPYIEKDATTICGYAGSEAERYAKSADNFLKDYENPFVNIGSDYSKQIEDKVDKVDGKGLSTEDYTAEEKEKLAGIESGAQVNEVSKDELNLKLYGTTDVYTLTEDDVLIENTTITAQKTVTIEHDVVIIPKDITEISAGGTYYDDETGTDNFIDGLYPIDIRAKQIICPSTLKIISGSNNLVTAAHNIFLSGEVILNEGLTSIRLENGSDTSGGYIGNTITLPSTIKHFDSLDSPRKLIIPSSVESIYVSIAYLNQGGSIYIYNPDIDFSKFNIYCNEGINVTLYGYAGSTAEAFAKEHGYTFVNIGSDYSAEIGDIETALDNIIAIQNSLLGVSE